MYRALYTAICGMIDVFSKGNDKIIVSTYQMGLLLQDWNSTGISAAGASESRAGLRRKGRYWICLSRGGLRD